jgi:hypothetical protein
MSNKKLDAKKAMLKQLSGKTRNEMNSKVGEDLKSKKLSKVTVAAPSKEGLKKGLSLAEKLIKAKYGMDEDEEETDEEHEHSCPACEDEGCVECEEESDEE